MATFLRRDSENFLDIALLSFFGVGRPGEWGTARRVWRSPNDKAGVKLARGPVGLALGPSRV